jgi:hypothetical protein
LFFTVPYKENLTLIDIKKEVHHQLGINPEKQMLIYSARELSGDDKLLSELNFYGGDVLFLFY